MKIDRYYIFVDSDENTYPGCTWIGNAKDDYGYWCKYAEHEEIVHILEGTIAHQKELIEELKAELEELKELTDNLTSSGYDKKIG